MGKGQNWSFDAIISVVIFLVAIIAFFYIISYTNRSDQVRQLSREGELLSKKILVGQNATDIAFIQGNKVLPGKLAEFANLSYLSLKSQLGIKQEFCMHFEDESGNLIYIEVPNGTGIIQKAGIGSSRFTISGVNCS